MGGAASPQVAREMGQAMGSLVCFSDNAIMGDLRWRQERLAGVAFARGESSEILRHRLDIVNDSESEGWDNEAERERDIHYPLRGGRRGEIRGYGSHRRRPKGY